MVEVSISILDVEEEKAVQTLYNLEVAKTDYFHIDVMDGVFVQQNTVQKMTTYCEYLKNITNVPLDVHLMVEDVESYIASFLVFEPNTITIHSEACKTVKETKKYLQCITRNHCRAGISLKPDTKVEEIQALLPFVHTVLVMSVEPGKGGQPFMPNSLEKIEALSAYREEQGLEFDIEVDGGIQAENIEAVSRAGANIVVTGSYILKSENYAQAVKTLKDLSM